MSQLVKYDAARKALQVASSIDEVRDIKDKAEAVRAYARQVRDHEMQSWAIEIKVRATRREGELLGEMQKEGLLTTMESGRPKCAGISTLSNIKTLKDLGISRHEAAEAHRMAKISEPEFETAINKVKDSSAGLTKAAVKRALNPQPKKLRENLDAAGRYAKLVVFVAKLYVKLSSKQRKEELREHVGMLVKDFCE